MKRILVAMAVLLAAVSVRAGATVSDYVQDGLVALYDGFENAGPGVHDPNATVWKDLTTNGYDLVQYGTYPTPACAHDGFVWTNKNAQTFWCGRAAAMVASSANVTVEAAGRPVFTANNSFFALSRKTTEIGLSSSAFGVVWQQGACLRLTTGGGYYDRSAFTTTIGCGGDMDQSGDLTFTRSGTTVKAYARAKEEQSWSCGSSTSVISNFFLGYAPGDGYYSPGMQGTINAFRVYDRALTADEIKWNRLVDAARFATTPLANTNALADTRLVDRTLHYRVRISSGSSGFEFSVNDGAAVTSYDAFLPAGTLLGVTNSTDEGVSRIAWLGLPAGVAYDGSGCSFAVTEPISLELESFRPTHVWAGGTGGFDTADNWRDNAGEAVSSAPGAGSRVFIPAPAEGEALVTCASPFTAADLRIGRLDPSSAGTAVLELQTLGTNKLTGVLRVYAGGSVRQAANPAGETVAYRCNVEADGDVTVNAGGEITAKASGYAKGYGYGGSSVGYGNGSHPSHGGVLHAMSGGGYAGTSKCYGSVRYPVTYGSASKSYNNGGTRGGGAIYLKTAGALRVDGAVDASAGDQTTGFYSGAGGSVQIHARSFAGSGSVWANGGRTSSNGICGSGGRVAVHLTGPEDFNGFSGTVRTWGGRGPAMLSYGCCGTVYIETAAQGTANGDLVLDNGCFTGDGEVEVNSYVTDAAVGRVRVKTGGRFKVCADGALSVRRGIDAAGGACFTSSGSSVTVTGTETALFSGTNVFANVSCAVPDKTILFSTMPADVFAIADSGSVVFRGAEDHPLALSPQDSAGQWRFHLGVDATADILRAAVSNSNARSGLSVLAISSENKGGNVNWGFSEPIVPGALMTWTGDEDAAWANSANWNPMRAPVETDRVTIPSGRTRYPVLTAGTTVQNAVTVASGASLTLAGGNLTVTNGFSCAGTFTSAGCETLLLTGAANSFAGATVNAGNGTVRFEGDLDQTFDPDGHAFAYVTFRKADGDVAIGNSLTARVFEVTAATTGVFSFAADKTFALDELYLNGVVSGAAALTVKSVTDGTAWKLNAGTRQHVSGVVAKDSDASGGEAIRADSLSSAPAADGNVNWTTGGKAARWTGGASGDWGTAANWTPNGVPDALTRVTISADAGESVAVTLAAGVSGAISNLLVGAGRGTVKLTANASLVVAENIEVATNATAVLNAFDPGNTAGGNVTVRAGGTLTHAVNDDVKSVTARIKLVADGDFILESGGMIDLRDKGYSSAPWGGTGGRMTVHGGRRPVWGSYTWWGSWCVGSVTEPALPGYGSSASFRGGGAVWISVSGSARVDGEILADSITASSGDWYSGSGGSVFLRCADLSGGGLVSASAKGVKQSCGGSGGRIAVHLTGSDTFDGFTGTMRTYGGWDQATPAGAPGTVYTCTRAQAAPGGTGGDLWIRNGGGQYGAAEISQEMDDTTVGSVHITNGCALVVHAGRTLTVNGDFLNDGTLTCSNGSTVVFATTNNALVRGANAFYNLTCATGDKTIRFAPQADGASVRVMSGGTVTLAGADKAHLLVLTNATEDAAWKLTLESGTQQQVAFVAAAGSDASDGAKVVAKSSRDDGNNENWNFPADIVPGEEIVWEGTVSDDFGDPSNWDRDRAPEPTDSVVVPATGCDPVITHDFAANRLELRTGARITLRGANLTVTNVLRCAGTLTTSDHERTTAEGNVDFTGGTYEAKLGTFTLAGGAAVTACLPGQAFRHLIVEKTGGGVAFTKGFAADDFTCRAGAATTLAFGAGERFAFEAMTLDGLVDGSALLDVASTTAEAAWRLAVGRIASVRGVNAQDADASYGYAVSADAPGTAVRCVNWTVGGGVKQWRSGATGSFTDAANWDPEGVPGATDRVEVVSGRVTLSEAATLRAVTVGGGAASAGFVVRAALTVTDSLEVKTNGTATLDVPVRGGTSLVVWPGGKVTHTANGATDLYKIDAAFSGDVIVEEGATVDVTGCGYAKNQGPGCAATAFHGGGAYRFGEYAITHPQSYGSIPSPVDLGSGSWVTAGGGAVHFKAGRTIRVDGTVAANGVDINNFYTGTGGSVWLEGGRFIGFGSVAADGGTAGNAMAGGGGRVSITASDAADFSGWTGKVTASGGYNSSHVVGRSGAGTVHWRAKGWAFGRVEIRNASASCTCAYTCLPQTARGDPLKVFKTLAFEVGDSRMTVTNAVKVADLDLVSSAAKIVSYADMTVRTLAHKNGKGWKASYPDCETRTGGQVRWSVPGMILIVK